MLLVVFRERSLLVVIGMLLVLLVVEVDHSVAFFLVLFLLVGEVAVGLGEAHFAFLVELGELRSETRSGVVGVRFSGGAGYFIILES